MKRLIAILASSLLFTLTGHGQQTTVTTNSAYLDALISRCALADWPVTDPVCAPFIMAVGKSVLNLSKQATQPTVVDPGAPPVVVPVPVPTPAPTQ